MLKKKTEFITKIETSELIDLTIREALREQARSLEKHLTDIDNRLRVLERKK